MNCKNLGIVILNFNASEDTKECIDSIFQNKTKYSYDVYVLDNGSEKEDAVKLKNTIESLNIFETTNLKNFSKNSVCLNNTLVISDENLGFAGGNNAVINVIKNDYDYLLLLNNDTVVTENFIEEMLGSLYADKEVGFASCRINNYYDKQLLWNCGGELKPWGTRRYYTEQELEKFPSIINAEFITGCALFLEKSNLLKFDGLTTKFFHGEEDFNYCWRMKHNKVIGKCLNKTMVYHKVSISSNKFGTQPGKMVCYYVCRFIDMKLFYPHLFWLAWKQAVSLALNIKWMKIGFDKELRKNMRTVLNYYSEKDTLNKEDTIKVWKLEL